MLVIGGMELPLQCVGWEERVHGNNQQHSRVGAWAWHAAYRSQLQL